MDRLMHDCSISDWIFVFEAISRCVGAIKALLQLEDLFNRRWKPRPV